MTRQPSPNIQWANNTHSEWWKDPGLRKNVAWVCFLYLGLFAFGYDTSLVTGMIASPRWNDFFDHPNRTRLGLIVASFYLPAVVCAPLISLSLDGLGRKYSVLLGCFGFILGSLISCFANSLGMLIAGRAILGTVNFLTIAACTCLVNEILHPRLRGIFGALIMTSLKLGDIVGALPFLLQALGPFIMVPFIPFCPESPRWLVSKGKEERALGILSKYHANGDRYDDLVKNEMEEITTSIRKEQENNQTSWKSLFKTGGNRRRLVVLTICCTGIVFTGSTVVSNYVAPTLRLIGVTSPAQITGINGGLTIVSALSSTAGALCVDILGRRPIWLGSTFGVLVTFSILTALMSSFIQSPNQSLAVAYIVVLYLYNIAWSFAWLPLTALYAAEILPYSLRAKGISYFVSLQSLLAALALFVNPIGIASLTWKYYIIYIGIIILHLVLIYFFFIETKGRTIEEVALVFDKVVPEGEREGSVKLYRSVMLRNAPRKICSCEARSFDDLHSS
ncbi:MFS general substrate transporter [Marasmius fiardii PR-910]|nr:MFS general substrate transporter [Marasmius fiardii PR-910]